MSFHFSFPHRQVEKYFNLFYFLYVLPTCLVVFLPDITSNTFPLLSLHVIKFIKSRSRVFHMVYFFLLFFSFIIFLPLCIVYLFKYYIFYPIYILRCLGLCLRFTFVCELGKQEMVPRINQFLNF